MVAMFFVWVVIITMSAGLIGGAITIYSEGFSRKDTFAVVIMVIILAVFITIGLSGSFTI